MINKIVGIILFIKYSEAIQEIMQHKFKEDSDPSDIKTVLSKDEFRKTSFQIPDEKWTMMAVQDIAYFLRNYKFNEWDRRLSSSRPKNEMIGFFSTFPTTPLESLHWEVRKRCYNIFYKCIIYLHSIINNAPLRRGEETMAIIFKKLELNVTEIEVVNKECKKTALNTKESGYPFESPIEKFLWSTTAFYFMCWYTLLRTPELSMLGEPCDNFANCLDNKFGLRNNDPRADDRLPFACASYSFCPDPCCPLKHVKVLNECYENINNPCFNENSNNQISSKQCKMNPNVNNNFKQLIAHKWNVSCKCRNQGFIWKSRYGMCVDINECETNKHKCDNITENCLNSPGSYICYCKWGYGYGRKESKCIKMQEIVEVKDYNQSQENYNFWAVLINVLQNIF